MSMKRMWAISSFTSEEDADDIRFLSIRELEIDRGYFSRPLSIEGSQSQTRAPRARMESLHPRGCRHARNHFAACIQKMVLEILIAFASGSFHDSPQKCVRGIS